MNLSKYCFRYRNYSPTTLFNALTKDEMVIDDELFGVLKKRAFHELDKDIEKELINSGVIVNDSSEDECLANVLFSSVSDPDEALEVTYAMTFSCNMRCTYCVQSEMPLEKECSEDAIVSGLFGMLDNRKPKIFHLSFFGGEPLLRMDKILGISSTLHDGCARRGIKFAFGITTNGTLLRAIDTQRMRSLGLRQIDVTLDGDRELHDSRRMYHDGRGSFDDILESLKALGGAIPVNLICNISGDGEFHSVFFEFLADVRNEVQLKSVRFKPFFDGIGRDACFYHDSHVEILTNIWLEAERHSLPVDKSFIIGPCGFFNENTIAVSPGGKVYPCTPFYGDDKQLLGNMTVAGTLDKKHLLKDNLPRRCFECVYVPICGGGCRFVSLRLQGDVAKATCEKKFFDSIFVTL